MTLLLATFGVALASAWIPVIPIEAYIGGAVAESSQSWWALALAATVGQMFGKIFIFELGRQSMEWAWLQRRMAKYDVEKYVTRLTEASERRPYVSDLVVLGSAVVGIPPFAVVSLVAGQLRVSLTRFLVWGSIGRFIRFAAVALGVAQLVDVF
jgi:membrane protein YqaA with SNARE-associated domain